jgi:Flp pilus assembly pilin Flp
VPAVYVYVHVHTALLALARPHGSTVTATAPRLRRDERGQTSAEYALVLLGAAAIALLLVAWATKSDLIGKLFDAVLNSITGKVK